MTTYDVIFVGGGFNALVCAFYVARAGKSVLVLEQRETTGGLVGTEEFSPGFRASVCFQSAELLHPSVVSDLDLPSHGLKVIRGGGTLVPNSGDGFRYFVGGGATVRGVPGEDRDGFLAFEHLVKAIGRVLEPLLTAPLPDIERRGVGDAIDLLKIGWKLKRLGASDMLEAMRLLPMNVKDALDERIGNDALKAAIAAPSLVGSWLAPRSPGSAFTLIQQRPGWVDGFFPLVAHVEGGMGGLASSLESAVVAAGARVLTGQEVVAIGSSGKRVDGVETSDGKRYRAAVVVSGVDPKKTLGELADSTRLEPEVLFALRGIRSRGSVAIVRYALDSLPSFGGASNGELSGRIQLGADLDALERAFDPIKYGEIPDAPWAEVQIPSILDATLAPDGKHVLTAWVQSIPCLDGKPDSNRDTVAAITTRLLEKHAPGFSKAIIDVHVRTPADIERDFGITNGCVYHVEPALDQSLYLRPMPGWFGYRTPIRGLYLCGAGTHPGGGASGLSGKNCATKILSDWE